jgi:hypothetical protein
VDGCCDHREMFADDDLQCHAVENLNRADAILFGRLTFERMVAASRPPALTSAGPARLEPWREPFNRTIDALMR